MVSHTQYPGRHAFPGGLTDRSIIPFDPILAATLRLPAELLRNLMLVLLALTVMVSLQTVGVGLAAAIGAFSGLAGLYVSFYLNIVSGSAIVLTATVLFLIVFLFHPRRGLLFKRK